MYVISTLAWAGTAVSWWGTGRYLLEIKRGTTRPRLSSWIAWGSANGVLMAVALLDHNLLAAVFDGLAALGNLSVLLLSAVKRAGERPDNSTDWTCLGAAGACLLAILLFPHMMVPDALLAMAANVAATWPTLRHAWTRPREEAWQLFAANGGANLLGLVSISAAGGVALANIAGPLISMTGNLTLVLITLGRGWLSRVEQTWQTEIVEAEQQLGLNGLPADDELAE